MIMYTKDLIQPSTFSCRAFATHRKTNTLCLCPLILEVVLLRPRKLFGKTQYLILPVLKRICRVGEGCIRRGRDSCVKVPVNENYLMRNGGKIVPARETLP